MEEMTETALKRLARRKGYEVETFYLCGKTVWRIRRLNWFSQPYITRDGLALYIREKAIDWGKGSVP